MFILVGPRSSIILKFGCRFTKIVNAIFQYTIFLQFCISTTVLCLSILKMSSKLSFDVNFVSSLFYLCAMLMQVYLYCWFGNEVTLKVGTEFCFLESPCVVRCTEWNANCKVIRNIGCRNIGEKVCAPSSG